MRYRLIVRAGCETRGIVLTTAVVASCASESAVGICRPFTPRTSFWASLLDVNGQYDGSGDGLGPTAGPVPGVGGGLKASNGTNVGAASAVSLRAGRRASVFLTATCIACETPLKFLISSTTSFFGSFGLTTGALSGRTISVPASPPPTWASESM